MKGISPPCPLCGSSDTALFASVHGRTYHRCAVCDLTFLDPADQPSAEAARAHYATHRNDPGDARYRAFLSRVADPLINRLEAGATGIDFGSGPGPTLSVMLAERGHPTALYDPLYAPDTAALQQRYDFVTCSETVEHFITPADDFSLIDRLVRPGGWIAIMTELLEPGQEFQSWRYARDPTHTAFFSEATFGWLARKFGWEADASPLPKNVRLFQKP